MSKQPRLYEQVKFYGPRDPEDRCVAFIYKTNGEMTLDTCWSWGGGFGSLIEVKRHVSRAYLSKGCSFPINPTDIDCVFVVNVKDMFWRRLRHLLERTHGNANILPAA